MRTRLACDLGDAASCRSARKLGHIRDVGSSDRQVPQPWQAEAVSTSVKPGQRKAGSITGRSNGPRSRASRSPFRHVTSRSPVPLRLGLDLAAAAMLLARADCPCHDESDEGGSAAGWAGTASHGFKFRSIRWGSSPMTLPGLSWFCGSKASLISRKTWTSSPYCLRRNCVRSQAAALGARDRPAGLDDDVVNAAGKRFQLGPVARVRQIEKRPQPQPAFAGVRVARST